MRTVHVSELGSGLIRRNPVYRDVKKIIDDVRRDGDAALRMYTKRFDGAELKHIRVPGERIEQAVCDPEYEVAMGTCIEHLKRFAVRQREQLKNFDYEVVPGVRLSQVLVPISRVGVYVPGGRYPLVSSLLMCAVPARVAGVEEIAVCTPPSGDGDVHPCLLSACRMLDIDEVYSIGGAQAIAAMAYGTETVRPVDKIVGPGNIYVTSAKKEVYGDAGIDMLAGPTELLIIADESADPELIAADLLAQAEHDENALPVLITTSRTLAEAVQSEIKRQLAALETRETAERCIEKNGLILMADSAEQCAEMANKMSPEHLEIHVRNAEEVVRGLRNYGSLFIGKYSAEVLGDYSSGLNHTLPTSRIARYRGGLNVFDFLKVLTTLSADAAGFRRIAQAAETLATLEGLHGHAESVRLRLKPSGR